MKELEEFHNTVQEFKKTVDQYIEAICPHKNTKISSQDGRDYWECLDGCELWEEL